MRAFVTGGAGFAGSHLVEYLLGQGHEVSVLAHPDEPLVNLSSVRPHVQIERADIRDGKRLFQILNDLKPQRLFHLAAVSSPTESLRNPRLTYEVNFVGTLELLLAWREIGMDCRLLYVSSAEVYGTSGSKNLPLREDCALRPANPYAASKAAAELLAFQFFESDGFPIVRVRPFNHTGPRQSSAFVCSSFARQVVEAEAGLRPPRVSVGDLKVRRDFSDVRDIVRGYYLLMENGEPGEVYHLCSGRAVLIETVLKTLLGWATKPIQVDVDEHMLRGGEPSAVQGDLTKTKQTIGWEPKYDLEATLRDLKVYWESMLRSRQLEAPA